MKKLFIFYLFCFIICINSESQAIKGISNYRIKYSLGKFEEKLFYIDLEEGSKLYIDCHGEGGQVDYFFYGPNDRLIGHDVKLYSNCTIEVNITRDGRYWFLSKNYSTKRSKIIVDVSEHN